MTIMQRLSSWGEALPVPDAISRMVIASLVGRTDRTLATQPGNAPGFAREMAERPIALHTDAANAQHYEVGTGVLAACLGPRMNYSCCLYPKGGETLAQAEVAMLQSYLDKAELKDGMSILDLG